MGPPAASSDATLVASFRGLADALEAFNNHRPGTFLALDEILAAMRPVLRRWRARQAEGKLLVGAGYRDEGFVFCHPEGGVYDPDRFSREFLRSKEYNRLHAHDRYRGSCSMAFATSGRRWRCMKASTSTSSPSA